MTFSSTPKIIHSKVPLSRRNTVGSVYNEFVPNNDNSETDEGKYGYISIYSNFGFCVICVFKSCTLKK